MSNYQGKHFDNHTLYIVTYDASFEEIDKWMTRTINTIGKPCKYKINHITPKNSDSFAFIRVSNKIVYNIMSGLNEDGTERYEYIDDEYFKMPDVPFEDALKEALKESDTDDWGEMMEIEERLKSKYEPKQLKIQLDPILETLPYNDEGDKFYVARSFVDDVEYPYVNNVLYCHNIPEWINYKIIDP